MELDWNSKTININGNLYIPVKDVEYILKDSFNNSFKVKSLWEGFQESLQE